MTLKEIEMRMYRHPLFEHEIPLQMQLGLPYFYKRNGQLFLRCFLHRRHYKSGMLLIYPNQYEVEFVYPFRNIVRFEDSQIYMPMNTEIPVCIVEAEHLLTNGKVLLDELYSSADQVIESWVQDGVLLEKSFSDFCNIRKKIIKEFSLGLLYGG